MNDVRIGMALDAMLTEAQMMGVQGVASVIVQPQGDRMNFVTYQRTVGRYFRPPQPEKRGPDDRGTNYLIGSYAKVAESLRTGHGSGVSLDPLLRCEFGWRGSVIAFVSDYEVCVSFSGGTPEEDLLIAEVGRKTLME